VSEYSTLAWKRSRRDQRSVSNDLIQTYLKHISVSACLAVIPDCPSVYETCNGCFIMVHSRPNKGIQCSVLWSWRAHKASIILIFRVFLFACLRSHDNGNRCWLNFVYPLTHVLTSLHTLLWCVSGGPAAVHRSASGRLLAGVIFLQAKYRLLPITR
jgi:hypothetical protein